MKIRRIRELSSPLLPRPPCFLVIAHFGRCCAGGAARRGRGRCWTLHFSSVVPSLFLSFFHRLKAAKLDLDDSELIHRSSPSVRAPLSVRSSARPFSRGDKR